MLHEITPLARGMKFNLNDRDHRGRDWQHGAKLDWILDQWRWSAAQEVTHCLFATDDLALVPGFVDVVSAILEVVPDRPVGFLANHPRAADLAEAGHRFYRTNSWLVGPLYALPRAMLVEILRWFESEPEGKRLGPTSWNDDNAINHWVTVHGPGETYHPLPAPIEHDADGDIPSTVGHGDEYSRERISWRRVQHPASGLKVPRMWDVEAMKRAAWWREGPAAPLLPVGGA